MLSPAPTRRVIESIGYRARSVTGKVKMTTDKGLVVVGREKGQKDKEWALALEPATRIEAGGKVQVGRELREGEAVTVTYTNRDGKIVAQSVKVMLDSGIAVRRLAPLSGLRGPWQADARIGIQAAAPSGRD
jgi:hypothetical protein